MRVRVIARRVRVAMVVVVALWPAVAVAQQIPIAPYQWPSRPDDPQRLQMPRRAPLTILPSVTVSEEFNDNINLSNANRRSDFITGITPAVNVVLESATYRLAAGYSFTADMYLREPDRNDAFDRQNFDLDTQWRPTEQLSLTLADGFVYTTNTNLLSPEGVSTGRNRAWSNSLRGGLAYRLDPQTTVRGGGSYTVQRYQSDLLEDSDVYTADVALDRALSRVLTGTLAYEVGYFDIEFEPKTWTHTPRLGFSYRVTDTITVGISGGPSFEVPEGGSRDNRIAPAVTASYEQRTFFGLVRADFDRRIGIASGIGGTTDNTTIGARADLITLMRGLTLSLAPRYAIVKSPENQRRIDIQTFTAPLTVTYRITAWIAAVAGYQFYRQRTGDGPVLNRSGLVIAEDADQNRVFVGLQFGYPLTFDRP